MENGFNEYELIYFDIKVLKDFVDDPRYHISNFDDMWHISIKTESELDDKIDTREKIVLDNIGFGYDESNQKVICAFLKQLSKLPIEMQLRFISYRNCNDVYLDPSYISSINGLWSSHVSIFEAIIYEIQEINRICLDNDGEKLFGDDFKDTRPKDFRLILLSTKKEYGNFISSLDKMIYDNVNKNFFKSKLGKSGGAIDHTGALKLLEEWLNMINVENNKITQIKDLILSVRKERNVVAHEINESEFNAEFYEKQSESLVKIYDALKIVMDILINLFDLEEYELEEWFIEDNIRTYSINEIKQEQNKNYVFMK